MSEAQPEKGQTGLSGGLAALIRKRPQQTGSPSSLNLDLLLPGTYQPRTRMDQPALQELADSIASQGVMQPVLVRQLKQGVNAGKYEIIAGERRVRASRLAGLETIPVLVRDVPDESAAVMALIENIQREDLNPLEEAFALQRLILDFKLTHEQAAKAVGRSRSASSNLLRLLNLTEVVQSMLMDGDIEMGHARALLPLERVHQISAALQVTEKRLSVRETESLVKRLSSEAGLPSKDKASERENSQEIMELEEQLKQFLQTSVQVRVKKRTYKRNGEIQEKGNLEIPFESVQELRALVERLTKP